MPVLPPALPMLRSAAASVSLHMLDYDAKAIPGRLYVCEPHTIQIIQLVEGPPPPRRIGSVVESSAAGSSYPSTSDSEEECSSYCSSIVTPDESSLDREPLPCTDDTYSTRMKRVHAWRDGFQAAPSDSRTSPLKRKMNQHQRDDDTASHTSKRSRSRPAHSVSRLIGHPCPACDTPFATLQCLRNHGRMPHVSEACRTAVEYIFES